MELGLLFTTLLVSQCQLQPKPWLYASTHQVFFQYIYNIF